MIFSVDLICWELRVRSYIRMFIYVLREGRGMNEIPSLVCAIRSGGTEGWCVIVWFVIRDLRVYFRIHVQYIYYSVFEGIGGIRKVGSTRK